ncbi:hypothetical protein LguiA_013172 [Lonicera macranthoides]
MPSSSSPSSSTSSSPPSSTISRVYSYKLGIFASTRFRLDSSAILRGIDPLKLLCLAAMLCLTATLCLASRLVYAYLLWFNSFPGLGFLGSSRGDHVHATRKHRVTASANACDSQTELKNSVISWRVIRCEYVRAIRIGGLYAQMAETLQMVLKGLFEPWCFRLKYKMRSMSLKQPAKRFKNLEADPYMIRTCSMMGGTFLIKRKRVPKSKSNCKVIVYGFQSSKEMSFMAPELVLLRTKLVRSTLSRDITPHRICTRKPKLVSFADLEESPLFVPLHPYEGEPISILDGVPVAIKDEIDCLPYPTTGGTKWLHKVRPCTDDASCVKRLRLCGAVLVGKTNMPELGAGTSGMNPHYG